MAAAGADQQALQPAGHVCLWCGPRGALHTDLRLYYKVTDAAAGWEWGWRGMCGPCFASNWKEYRGAFKGGEHWVHEQAYRDWQDHVRQLAEQEAERMNWSNNINVVFDGRGGPQKWRRQQLNAAQARLGSLEYWLHRHSQETYKLNEM